MYACLGVTCHLRFWQDDRGLLRAAVARVGTQSELWRKEASHRFFRDSNSQSFDHESGALPTSYSGSHYPIRSHLTVHHVLSNLTPSRGTPSHPIHPTSTAHIRHLPAPSNYIPQRFSHLSFIMYCWPLRWVWAFYGK